LGRISHEKRIDTMIEILSRVRQLGHDVHLHIIGPLDESPYSRSIERMCNAHADWVTAEGGMAGKEKIRLLTEHRYAIHGRKAEPFGIVVAEMAKAGCIPFVPDDGGAPEIVGDERLCYRDIDDAVRKIDDVLRHDKLQRELREKTLARGQLFGVEDYQKSVRRVVDEVGSNHRDRFKQRSIKKPDPS
jgi:glycosyltransferase involved in cell wall biosynthesis